MSTTKTTVRARANQVGKTAEQMELRVRMLLRNGLTSKSGMTLADTEVLKEITSRLGYDASKLKSMDISYPTVNPFAKLK